MVNVLQINKFFYNRGGSETHVLGLCRLLADRGNNVTGFSSLHPRNEHPVGSEYFVSCPDTHGSLADKFRSALRIFGSREVMDKLKKIIGENKIDIAHLHNFSYVFPISMIRLLRKSGIPTVMTLHDYKLACPASTFYAGSRVCERCKGEKFYNIILQGCNSSNKVKSAIHALELYYYRKTDILSHISAFISPSRFLIDKLREHGLRGRFYHLPNFIRMPEFSEAPEEMSVLFAGQLSELKGIRALLGAAELLPSVKFRICGGGPLEHEVLLAAERLPNVRYLGFLRHGEVMREMVRSAVLAFPSEWYENCPMTIIEALGTGRPVVASRLGGMVELVMDGRTGLLFEPGEAEDLAGKIRQLLDYNKRKEMGRDARDFAEREFSEEVFYGRLLSIYREVMEHSNV